MLGKKRNILLIAEAGVNHNGDVALAKRLIDAAVEAGADAVKFQTFRSEALVSASAPKAAYQQRTTDKAESQLDMLRRLELSRAAHLELLEYARARGIAFLSTPFDLDSIDLLADLGLSTWKIPSGEITNLPYLRKIGSLDGKIILSTGMADLEEARAALQVLERAGTPRGNVALLHCTTEYPAPYDEVNLRALATLRGAFPDCAGVGYSDHTEGIEISLAAVALGATIIEKHFTLDRGMEGPDHKASLEPRELAALVRGIRRIESAMGSGEKTPAPSELTNKDVARKSIVAARDIAKGEILSEANLTTKRPGSGISPMRWDEFIGMPAPRDLKQDELL